MDKFFHQASVIKSESLPDALKAESEDTDLWAYASVETVDRDADIVRVAGISLANHRPDSPVKILASHQRTLPNGESPVIGRVTGFKQVTHKSLNVPALAFAAKFAPTPLGKHYKSLYDSGDMTDFSIGFRPVKAEPIKDGGLDYQSTELMEISAVALPANQHAAVMRAMEETYPQAKSERMVFIDLVPTLDKQFKETLEKWAECLKRLDAHESTLASLLEDLEDTVTVVKAKEAKQPDDLSSPVSQKSKSEPTPDELDAKSLVRLWTALKAFAGE